jgi:hypothetical protein
MKPFLLGDIPFCLDLSSGVSGLGPGIVAHKRNDIVALYIVYLFF